MLLYSVSLFKHLLLCVQTHKLDQTEFLCVQHFNNWPSAPACSHWQTLTWARINSFCTCRCGFVCADFCFVHADLTLPLVLPPAAKVISTSSVFGMEILPVLKQFLCFNIDRNRIMPERCIFFVVVFPLPEKFKLMQGKSHHINGHWTLLKEDQ